MYLYVKVLFKLFILKFAFIIGGDYMIPACRNETSTRPAETDFNSRLNEEIKFRPPKTGQFSTCYLIILNIIICMHFLWFFFFFFFVSISFYKTEDSQISSDLNFF